MADKKLNEVTKVTDMAYVPVIMSDGSIGQIAKADLASVVAGQFRAGDANYESANMKELVISAIQQATKEGVNISSSSWANRSNGYSSILFRTKYAGYSVTRIYGHLYSQAEGLVSILAYLSEDNILTKLYMSANVPLIEQTLG